MPILKKQSILERMVHVKLSEEEMMHIEGGSAKNFAYSIAVGLGGFILLLIGIIDGYTDSSGVEHKKLEGDTLNRFIEDCKITAYTYGNLGGTDVKFAEKLPPVKEGGDAAKDFANGRAEYRARISSSNQGHSTI